MNMKVSSINLSMNKGSKDLFSIKHNIVKTPSGKWEQIPDSCYEGYQE